MGYVDDNLLQGESVTYRAKLHWAVFLAPAVLFVFGLLFLVVGAGAHAEAASVFGVIFWITAGCVAVSRWVTSISSEFAVTDKRVLIKVGLIRRRTVELLLTKVETIGVDQGIIGRIFNFGTIIVTGTGGTKEPFKSISDPLRFRKEVQARLIG